MDKPVNKAEVLNSMGHVAVVMLLRGLLVNEALGHDFLRMYSGVIMPFMAALYTWVILLANDKPTGVQYFMALWVLVPAFIAEFQFVITLRTSEPLVADIGWAAFMVVSSYFLVGRMVYLTYEISKEVSK